VPANTIDGGQAEYVRVPLADTTLVKTPKGMYGWEPHHFVAQTPCYPHPCRAR